jgi:hypothetical protein
MRQEATKKGKLTRSEKRKIIKDYNLKVGESLLISAYNFIKYPRGNGYGTLRGTMIHPPFLRIDVPRVLEQDYTANKRYMCTLNSVRRESTGYQGVILIGSHPRPIARGGTDGKKSSEGGSTPQNKSTSEKSTDDGSTSGSSNIISLLHEKAPERINTNIEGEFCEYDDVIYASGPNLTWIPIHDWEKLTRYGCAWCGQDLHVKDHKEILWLSRDAPLCPGCGNNWCIDPISDDKSVTEH